MGRLSAPEPLEQHHHANAFDCGEPSLNEWLVRHALKNQDSGASRTFVVCEDSQVVAYYSLATGSIERLTVSAAVARNMPNQIPVIVLGRLAVDLKYQKRRLGISLLRDAMLRAMSVASDVGVRCLLVHALSDHAKQFYLNHGFRESRLDTMTLLLPIEAIQRNL